MLSNILFLTFVAAAQALTWKGVDWSSTFVEEAAGKKCRYPGEYNQNLEYILKNSGVNTVRQRIWVNPAGGTYDLTYNINLAKRAKAAGLGVYLDLHYSDNWADKLHQTIPSGWPQTNINDLTYEVYNYTLSVANTFAAASLPISLISIGNEITSGLLYPLGANPSHWNIASILHSASTAIHDSQLAPTPKIMIHLDDGWDAATQDTWYTNVLAAGPLLPTDFDIMGVSYYPFYTPAATLSALRASLSNLSRKWGKALVVAETNWPASCPSPAKAFPGDTRYIPFSVAGQATWMREVAGIVSGVKGGEGIFYWEPAWIQNANLGSSCADNLLVDQNGNAREGLAVFAGI